MVFRVAGNMHFNFIFCRCQSLQIHFDLEQYRSATCTNIDELRDQRRAWQHKLNHDIQRIALELVVNIFRFSEFKDDAGNLDQLTPFHMLLGFSPSVCVLTGMLAII